MISSSEKYLLVVAGPTAVGKTSTAIKLANHFDAPILSADSRQFYREMNIGTAKPTARELSEAEHHFINSHSISNPINAGQYEKLALDKIQELHGSNKLVILTGGSGLFIDAVCSGLDDLPSANKTLRDSLQKQLTEEGIEALQEKLKTLDPKYFETAEIQNPHRLIRAIEICESSGNTITQLKTNQKKNRPFQIVYLALNIEREKLYLRINARVDLMLENGLECEVKSLESQQHLSTLNTVGYSEFFRHFKGEISRNEAIELIKRNSRRYAKRQLTWFRRNEAYNWFEPTELEKTIDLVNYQMNKNH